MTRPKTSTLLPRLPEKTVELPTLHELHGKRLHFMGAGGIGVSAMMELARARGAIVSGCNENTGGQVAHLKAVGIPIEIGHDPKHIDDCDELIYTPAIPDTHPEIMRARELGKRVSVRMAMLGRLVRGTRAVCITGSHGKTTTTWMTSHLLIEAGLDPEVLLGGVVKSMGSNVRVSNGREENRNVPFVLETDESDNRLTEIIPACPLVTNIDNDHLEHFGGMDQLQEALTRFLASAAQSNDPRAALFGCGDDPRVLKALEEASKRSNLPAFSYGFNSGVDIRARNIREYGMSSRFDIWWGQFGVWRDVELPMPGRHNILNALGAISIAWRMLASEESIRKALSTCERVGRRFEIKGEVKGVRVVDDYGHHPTELRATMSAAITTTPNRVGILFQPHRYSRTHQLMDEFADCLAHCGAGAVFLLPVYAASEEPIAGADHEALATRVREFGHKNVIALKSIADGVEQVACWAKNGDTVLVQGAGDVTKAAPALVERLRSA